MFSCESVCLTFRSLYRPCKPRAPVENVSLLNTCLRLAFEELEQEPTRLFISDPYATDSFIQCTAVAFIPQHGKIYYVLNTNTSKQESCW